MDEIQARIQIEQLVSELNRLTDLYDQGIPEITDAEWDVMYFKLMQMENEWNIILSNSPTQKVNYTIVNELEKVKHNHPMLSLDKTKDWNDFLRYFSNLNASKDVVGMLKLDGLTCSLRYSSGKLVSAETRGNGEIGENILHNALVINNIPKRINYQDELIVDGEIICTYKDFKEFQEEYANPRNFAAGSIRLLDSKECAERKLRFVLWNVVKGPHNKVIDNLTYMQKLGFEVVSWVSSFDWDAKEFLIERAVEYGYPIDGLVGRFNDIEYGESLGATDHHSRAAYAFKFDDTKYQTTLKDIEWNTSRYGLVAPVAIFDEIDLDGAKTTRATLHNVSIIKKLQLGIGDTITVYKANMVIPAIDKNLTKSNTYKLPTVCPTCGKPLELKTSDLFGTENLYCTNEQCKAQLIGKLTNFVSKYAMNIQGVSEAIIETLIDNGCITCYSDIYTLEEHKDVLIEIDGFGEKSYENLINAINKSRNTTLERFIVAMGIPNVGRVAAKTIAKHFKGDLNAFIRETVNKFDYTTLQDFGEVANSSIYTWLMNFPKRDLVALSKCLTFNTDEYQQSNIVDNPFNGKNVAVTGKLNSFTRDSINAKLESLGAKPVNGVTSKTDYLINNDSTSQSSKNKKANDLNIPIITEAQFLTMIGE